MLMLGSSVEKLGEERCRGAGRAEAGATTNGVVRGGNRSDGFIHWRGEQRGVTECGNQTVITEDWGGDTAVSDGSNGD